MKNMGDVAHELKHVMMMVLVQFLFGGANIMFKLAAVDGMSLTVLIAYRFIFASAFNIPVALFLRSKSAQLTWTVLFQAFLCGLFGGTLFHNLFIKGLVLTSVSFVTAMTNLIPAITFVMGILFRLERLDFKTAAGKAKVAGTIIGVGGAMLLTFYKGVEIELWSTNIDILHGDHNRGSHVAPSHRESGKFLLGFLATIACCVSYSIWLLIQIGMSKRYPCPYSSSALMHVMASIQTTCFALLTEKDWSQWKLGWNIRLLTVTYTGILASGVAVILTILCVHAKGALFVSIFSPLTLLIVVILSSIILTEKIHLGSVLGGVLIVGGLYLVLWGKSREMKTLTPETSEESKSVDCSPNQNV